MAEFTNGLLQLVAARANVLFSETPVRGNGCCIQHRAGSGLRYGRPDLSGDCN